MPKDQQDTPPLRSCAECAGEIFHYDMTYPMFIGGLIHEGCMTSRIGRIGIDFDLVKRPACEFDRKDEIK